MAACTSCNNDVPAGSRWCPVCHSSVAGSRATLASPGKRLGAFVLDVAIPFFALVTMLGLAGASESFALGFILFIGYWVWALRLFAQGTTPGKKLLGMRVIKEAGAGAGFGTMLLRETVGKWISGLIFSLGFLWILFDKDRQGWHDKLASTYVVQ